MQVKSNAEVLNRSEKMKDSSLICLPGQRLCLCDKVHTSGQGTYERQGYIYSQLAGYVDIIEKDRVKIVEVHSNGEKTVVPGQGDIVTAQVYIITQQFCKCFIKCVGDTVLRRPFRALIRREDVKATEKDKVEIYKSFRPGDIILARVVSYIIYTKSCVFIYLLFLVTYHRGSYISVDDCRKRIRCCNRSLRTRSPNGTDKLD